MKVICIKTFKYGQDTYYTEGTEYETEGKGKRVYTVSAAGKPGKYFQLESDVKETCYRFPAKEFKKHFMSVEEIPATPLKNKIEPKMGIRPKKEIGEFDVRETFLQLTSYTYPYGNEHRLRNFLPENVGRDSHGNYFYNIGSSRTIFACHLDTVSTKGHVPVKHVFDGNMIRTDGTTTLGADDKAGVTLLLYMIDKKVPGTYYFFIGEEVGCIGSKAASKSDNFSDYDRIVSFDRRNTCSVITFQAGTRCCSEDFATALSKEYIGLGLDLKPDNTGIYTDSAEFTDIIPECTNISVGYYSEHTHAERQDIVFLEKLCEASAIINWEALPTVRDPKVIEKKYNNNNTNYNSNNVNNIGRNRAQQWNNGHHSHNNLHNNHNRRKNNRDNFKNYDFHDYDGNGSWNSDECLIDSAFEEDRKARNKREKRSKKHRNNNVDLRVVDYKQEEYNSAKDIYLTFREFLTEQHFDEDHFMIETDAYNAPIFSSEENDLLEDLLVEDWRL